MKNLDFCNTKFELVPKGLKDKNSGILYTSRQALEIDNNCLLVCKACSDMCEILIHLDKVKKEKQSNPAPRMQKSMKYHYFKKLESEKPGIVELTEEEDEYSELDEEAREKEEGTDFYENQHDAGQNGKPNTKKRARNERRRRGKKSDRREGEDRIEGGERRKGERREGMRGQKNR